MLFRGFDGKKAHDDPDRSYACERMPSERISLGAMSGSTNWLCLSLNVHRLIVGANKGVTIIINALRMPTSRNKQCNVAEHTQRQDDVRAEPELRSSFMSAGVRRGYSLALRLFCVRIERVSSSCSSQTGNLQLQPRCKRTHASAGVLDGHQNAGSVLEYRPAACGGSFSFLLHSFFPPMLGRNYSSLSYFLSPLCSACLRSSPCSPQVGITGDHKVDTRANVRGNSTLATAPRFVVHARPSAVYDEENAPRTVSSRRNSFSLRGAR